MAGRSLRLWQRLTESRSPVRPFFVIAGTNVIEDRDSLLSLAENLTNVINKFGLPFIFKASYDKANRSAVDGYRGIGREKGLRILSEVRSTFDVPILTDVHEIAHINDVAEVADVIQIPAFLCRQTDLLVEAGKTGKIIHVKKGQFASIQVMTQAIEKIRSLAGNEKVMVCERGSTYGREDLVFDPRNLIWMRDLGVPVVMDCTHSCQIPPGLANPFASAGEARMVSAFARAAVAIGIDGLFIEFHQDPGTAPVDKNLQLPLREFEPLLMQLLNIAKNVTFYQSRQQ